MKERKDCGITPTGGLSDSVRPERLDLAMLLALEAAKSKIPSKLKGALQRALERRPEVDRFLHVPEGTVTSVAFGPRGTHRRRI